MRNLKFIMKYNGAGYKGYQVQPEEITVQGTVECALRKLFRLDISITGCSRTDTGVHALEYCFNCLVPDGNTIPPDNLAEALNALLPPDICIISCVREEEGFHARRSSKGKEYLYLLNNGVRRDIFTPSFHYPRKLDFPVLEEAAALFKGEHDFSAFCKAESLSRLKSPVRSIYDIRIDKDGAFVRFYISGSGFLHNMVRIIMGTLIYASEGKINADGIKSALAGGKRQNAGMTLPPEGLYLCKVFY